MEKEFNIIWMAKLYKKENMLMMLMKEKEKNLIMMVLIILVNLKEAKKWEKEMNMIRMEIIYL